MITKSDAIAASRKRKAERRAELVRAALEDIEDQIVNKFEFGEWLLVEFQLGSITQLDDIYDACGRAGWTPSEAKQTAHRIDTGTITIQMKIA